MPTTVTHSIHSWKCSRCGRDAQVTTDAKVVTAELPKPFYTYGAKMSIDTVGRDFQGGIVGPGPMNIYTAMDVCDKCFSAFMKFWKNVDKPEPPADRSLVTSEPSNKGGYRGGKPAGEFRPPAQV